MPGIPCGPGRPGTPGGPLPPGLPCNPGNPSLPGTPCVASSIAKVQKERNKCTGLQVSCVQHVTGNMSKSCFYHEILLENYSSASLRIQNRELPVTASSKIKFFTYLSCQQLRTTYIVLKMLVVCLLYGKNCINGWNNTQRRTQMYELICGFFAESSATEWEHTRHIQQWTHNRFMERNKIRQHFGAGWVQTVFLFWRKQKSRNSKASRLFGVLLCFRISGDISAQQNEFWFSKYVWIFWRTWVALDFFDTKNQKQ